MPTEKVLTDIPEKEVPEVVAQFKLAGCDPVKTEKQTNGLWTVRAVCPDE